MDAGRVIYSGTLMAKYSFFCENCGYLFQSDDKVEVATIRYAHRVKKSMTKKDADGNTILTGNHSCRLRRLPDGTATRPGLVPVVAESTTK